MRNMLMSACLLSLATMCGCNKAPTPEEERAEQRRKAAEQGDATAQRTLGKRYKRGEGVEKNMVEAATWFHKASEQGYVSPKTHYWNRK